MAMPARRAARLVTGPLAVKVQRAPRALKACRAHQGGAGVDPHMHCQRLPNILSVNRAGGSQECQGGVDGRDCVAGS